MLGHDLRMVHDPFGRAVRDQYRGERSEPLIDRDGPHTRRHDIDCWYFGDHNPTSWRDQWIDGPFLDIGAGAGRDALYHQDRHETVAIDISQHLVDLMADRGVTDVRQVDMFELRDEFGRDRFRSVQAIGTQVGLAGSMRGVTTWLHDLAAITTPDAVAVLDNYSPTIEAVNDLFAYRPDPTPGLAHRVFHVVYEGDVGRTLLFRLFSVERLQDAATDTPWVLVGVNRRGARWRAALEKS